MALSRKKSRKIVVGEDGFHWSLSQDSGYMVLVAQDASGQGRKLEVVISDDKNIVTENGNYSIELGNTGKPMITPKLVRQIILDAMTMGWNPRQQGSPVELSLNGLKLEVRRGL